MRLNLLFFWLMLCSVRVLSQPLAIDDNKKPIKLDDVVKAYRQSGISYTEDDDEEERRDRRKKHVEKETGDYHFDRWLWYWSQHKDENGYLVPPAKNWEEWKNYTNRIKNSQYKTTQTTAANQADWHFKGPSISPGGYMGIGRINAMDFHPTDPNTYWIGSAGGGVWKTTNDGLSWAVLTDSLPVLSVSDIDVNPKNVNTLYLCTGDRDNGGHYSIGVLKSVNGGQTWDTVGLKWTVPQFRQANCLVINSIDTNSLTLASSEGIYKSYNAGQTWSLVKTGNFKQVLYHPTDTNKMFASTYGGGGAQIYRSANGGKTWTQVTSFTSNNRITIAVTPANIGVVKAVVANSSNNLDGVYNSTDTGKTFIKIYNPTNCSGDIIGSDGNMNGGCSTQGWYDLSIVINPANVNEVYVGGVNTWKSSNGGSSWVHVTQWYNKLTGLAEVHADKHFHKFHPLVPGRLYECNDGGLYYSANPASTSWNEIGTGIEITQFYRNAVCNGSSFVLGGAQDNGTKGHHGGIWSQENGGDGMDCQIDYSDSETYYTGVQYGKITRTSLLWGDADISSNIPGNPKGGWITPYIVSPHNPAHIVAGYKMLWFSDDHGDTWYQLSSDSLDKTEYDVRVAMTPASPSTIYAVADNIHKLFYTHNFSPSSVTSGNPIVFNTITVPYNVDISDIKVDHKDKDHLWLTFKGYSAVKVAEYKSGTWTQMSFGLPNVPVNCVEVDTSNYNLYVGTDVATFLWDTAGKQWTLYNKNLPAVHVTDLGINYKSGEIWASTYGRGMWSSIKQDFKLTPPPDTTDTTNIVAVIPYSPSNFTVSPNPNNGEFTIKTGIKELYGKETGIIVMDYAGKLVMRKEDLFDANGKMKVSVSSLARGVYVIEVTSNRTVLGRQRIIIN